VKITKVTVTDEAGIEHTWEGVGFASEPRSITKKTDSLYQQQITIGINLPSKQGVKA
jgi:hypothetical protein